jgi:DNA-binding CsgD family transcriptional regulator
VGAPSAERTRQQLASLAASGLDQQTFASTAIPLLQQAVPFDASCTAGLDPATHLVTATVKLAIDHDHDLEWAQYEYGTEDVAKFVDLARRADPVTTVEIETGGDVARSSRLAEFLRPNYRFAHELRAALRVDGAAWAGICLFRQEGSSGFSPAEIDFVASITESFALGMRMGLISGAHNGEPSVHGPSVVIVGADDAVDQLSPGAEQRLAELGGDVALGRLPMHLLTLVAAARAFARGEHPSAPRLRVRSASGEWLVAHASTLASRDGSGSSVVITIEEARPPEIVPLVVAAFGLSPREQEVVRLVLQGVDTAQIAAALHLSAYTVQDHLKSIFSKAGVRSRRELTAKVFFDQYSSRLGGEVGPSGWFVDDRLAAAP